MGKRALLGYLVYKQSTCSRGVEIIMDHSQKHVPVSGCTSSIATWSMWKYKEYKKGAPAQVGHLCVSRNGNFPK